MAKKKGLTVTIDFPQYPPGHEIGVQGLGVVKNGESIEVGEEQEQAFLSVQGRTVKTAFEGAEGVTVEGEGTVAEPEPQPEPEQEGEGEGEGEETKPEE